MKPVALVPLAVTGFVLAYVAHRAGARDYVPPSLASEREVIPVQVSPEVPPGMIVHTFDVTGMCCEGCVAKLYRTLASVEGVREAAVDFQEGTAQVVVPTAADVTPLLSALAFDKYEAELRN